jgi:long-chain fatty acid transport protein
VKHAIRPVCALLAYASAISSAHAAGYYSGSRGGHATGRAGAFVAKADDLTAVTYNPAGLASLNTTVIELGNRFSYQVQEFSRSPTLDTGSTAMPQPEVSFAPVKSAGLQALDPLLGIGTNFGLKDWGFAIAAYAPAGSAGASFPVDGGSRYLMVSREALMLNYALSAGYRITDFLGIGVSLQAVVMPSLKYSLVVNGRVPPAGATPVSSQFDMLSTIEASDMFTPYGTIGAWLRPAKFLEFGASVQLSPWDIVAKGQLDVEPLSPPDGITEDQKLRLERLDPVLGYVGANDVELTLPLPPIARAGVRYVHMVGARELFDIELDVVYEGWSQVDKIHLATNGLVAQYLGQNPIQIGDIDIQKRWKDTFTFALGGDVSVVPDLLKMRAGVSYETAAADPAYASVDFATGAQIGAGLGASVVLGGLEVGLALEYRVQPTVTVRPGEGRVYQQTPGAACVAPYTDPAECFYASTTQQPSPTVNEGSYNSSTLGATLDLTYRF